VKAFIDLKIESQIRGDKMVELELIYVIAVSIGGSILGAVVGWAGSTQAFNAKQWILVFVPPLLGGLGYVASIDLTTLTYSTYIGVFIAGAGLTSMTKQGADAFIRMRH
jgi:hypothetical protein